jgi:hypothetical protein
MRGVEGEGVPLAAWRVGDRRPVRIARSSVALERSLEEWVEADPSLVVDGRLIVGRQVGLAAGRLDLLGIDPSGRWMVVEIKAGRLYRDVLTQALDYVALIHKLPAERLQSITEEYLTRHPTPGAIDRLSAALAGEADTVPREVAAVRRGNRSGCWTGAPDRVLRDRSRHRDRVHHVRGIRA